MTQPAENGLPVHWGSGDSRPTSLHGNGAASFERTTLDAADVTCRLCRYLLAAEPSAIPPAVPSPDREGSDQ